MLAGEDLGAPSGNPDGREITPVRRNEHDTHSPGTARDVGAGAALGRTNGPHHSPLRPAVGPLADRPVVPAALGAFAVTVIWTFATVNSPNLADDSTGLGGAALWAVYVCYAPLLVWGPLLALVTAAYYRRRTGQALRSIVHQLPRTPH